MKKLFYALSLFTAFGLGYAAAGSTGEVGYAQPSQKAAYVIFSNNVLKPDELGPYRDAARPLVQQAGGIQVLAAGDAGRTVRVLEGEWPYKGRVVVEKFRSMKDLLDFWYSPGYQKAIKLREGALKSDFIIAIEATD